MTKRRTYPTWVAISRNLTVSEEMVDDTPDWEIYRDLDTKKWHAKGRTSAHWLGKTFATVTEAQHYIEQECVR